MSDIDAGYHEQQCNSARLDSSSKETPGSSGKKLQRTNSDGIFALSSEKQRSVNSSGVSESLYTKHKIFKLISPSCIL